MTGATVRGPDLSGAKRVPPILRWPIYQHVAVGEVELNILTSTSDKIEKAGLTEDLVNAAVEWKRELRPDVEQHTSLYLTPDFLKKLQARGVEPTVRWQKAVTIFNFEHVFAPHYASWHYTLYAVCKPTAAIPSGRILFMNSLRGGADESVAQLLRTWLAERAAWESIRDRAPCSFDARTHTYPLVACKVPEQKDGINCGLLVACNVDAFMAARAAGEDGTTVRLCALRPPTHAVPCATHRGVHPHPTSAHGCAATGPPPLHS